MEFSAEEIERYARHLVLAGVGGPGQQKLKRARLLVVGAGGLGAPVLQYAAAAGIGTVGIADHDTVSLSNLQRQVIHATAAVGRPKAESAAATMVALNPAIRLPVHAVRIDEDNAGEILSGYDLVADCTDNFAARYCLSDACFRLRKPLVTAAVGQFDGSVTTLVPYERGDDGRPNPTYRCLFPEPPPDGLLPSCAEAGVLGALTGLLGCIQALEIVKLIVGTGSPLVGRLLMVDARDMRFETVRYGWDPGNPLNGEAVAG